MEETRLNPNDEEQMRDPTAPHSEPSRRDAAVAKDRLDDWLDRALEDTFPASDPVATPPRGAAPHIEDSGETRRMRQFAS